jgi:hypothetical protein
MELNYLTMFIATIAAVGFSTIWYMTLQGFLGRANGKMQSQPSALKIVAEFVRTFLLVYILAHVLKNVGALDWHDGLRHAFWLWLAFPLVIFFGLSVWENVKWKEFLVHSGDWLIKMGIISVILTL